MFWKPWFSKMNFFWGKVCGNIFIICSLYRTCMRWCVEEIKMWLPPWDVYATKLSGHWLQEGILRAPEIKWNELMGGFNPMLNIINDQDQGWSYLLVPSPHTCCTRSCGICSIMFTFYYAMIHRMNSWGHGPAQNTGPSQWTSRPSDY